MESYKIKTCRFCLYLDNIVCPWSKLPFQRVMEDEACGQFRIVDIAEFKFRTEAKQSFKEEKNKVKIEEPKKRRIEF